MFLILATFFSCANVDPIPKQRFMVNSSFRVNNSIIQVEYRHTYKQLDQYSIEHYPSTIFRITLPVIVPLKLAFIGQRTDYKFFGVDIPATNTLVRTVYVKEPGGWAIEPVPSGWTSQWKTLGEGVSMDAPAFLNIWAIVFPYGQNNFFPLLVGFKSL